MMAFLLAGAAALPFGMVHHPPMEPNRLLLNQRRATPLDFVRNRAGDRIADQRREGNLSWGPAQRHVYLMQRANLMLSREVDRRRVLSTDEVQPPAQQVLGILSNRRAREISVAVLTTPGLGQKELVERLGLTWKVFRHYIYMLVAAGLVIELEGARSRIYHPSDLLRAEFAPKFSTEVGVAAASSVAAATPGR